MSFFKGFVLLTAIAAVWCQECTNDSPDNELTCPELIGLGSGFCDEDFMKRENRCARSCGRAPCPPIDSASQGSVTLIGKVTGDKTSAGPAPASVEISAPTPPPETTPEEPTEPEAVEEVSASGNCKPLKDLIAGNGELSFLKDALESSGLVDTLNGFTGIVFAPTNAAFDALLSELELSRDAFFSGNPQVIQQLLKVHVVSGAALTLDQLEGQTLTPLLGGAQQVSISGGSIASPAGPTARVAKSLNEGCPAIIHIIDNVIIPRPDDGG